MSAYEAPKVQVVSAGELAASVSSLASSGGGGEDGTAETLPTLAETLYQNFAIGSASDNYHSHDVCVLIEALWSAVKGHYSSASSQFQSWVFFRSLGGICYNDDSDLKRVSIGLAWDEVAGPNVEFDYLVTNTLNLGNSISGAISKAVSASHVNSGGVDFAHFCITTATHLATYLNLTNADVVVGGFGLEQYGLSNNAAVCALAGWLGDASLVDAGNVSMRSSDTLADLDANLLAAKYLIANGESAGFAIRNYFFYFPSNRYDDFKTRNSLTKSLILKLIFKMLVNQFQFSVDVLAKTTAELEKLYKSNFGEAYENFIARL